MKLKSKKLILALVCLMLLSMFAMSGCGQQTPAEDTGDEGGTPVEANDPINGRVVDFVVGFTPGGSFDTVARLVAPFYQKYLSEITGVDQTVIVTNLPGAASGLANGTIYNEPADSTRLLMGSASAITQQVGRGSENVNWDVLQYTHLGSLDRPARAMVLSPEMTIESFQELLDTRTPLLFGTSGFGSNEHINGQVLMNVLKDAGIGDNLQFDFVHYEGSGEVDAAILSGECNATMSSTVTAQAHRNNGAQILFQTGTEQGIADVGMLRDIIPADAADLIDNLLSSKYFLVGSPDMDPALADVFARALEMTANDPEFIANAQKAALNVNYLNPEEDLANTQATYDALMQYEDLFRSFYE